MIKKAICCGAKRRDWPSLCENSKARRERRTLSKRLRITRAKSCCAHITRYRIGELYFPHFLEVLQCGWYKEVCVKDLSSHAIKALLVSRALLVKIKRDIENQIRGLLKNLGLVIGRAKLNVFAVRAAELAEARPELAAAIEPLLKAREAVERQVADLDRKVLRLARDNAQVRRFMTAPGVGPITALCFLATIDDPTRFKRSRSVGAYAGLTTRRYASGEIDWTGRISKCGDKMLRSYLYEAANVLLTRVAKWSALKAWGVRLAKRSGLRKAKVAVARKIAVILHRMWIEGTEFKWSSKEAANQPA